MKLLFSFKLCALLDATFPSSSQARLLGLDQADEPTLWKYAAENGFALVTQDADFAERAALRGHPPKIIWLRCGNSATAAIAATLIGHTELIAAFLTDDTATCLEIY